MKLWRSNTLNNMYSLGCASILPMVSLDLLSILKSSGGGIPIFSLLFPENLLKILSPPTDPVDPTMITVTVGDHDISKYDGELQFQVSKVIMHKDFKWQVMNNDICLLKLLRPIVFDHKVSPICLPWNLTETDMKKKGQVVVLSGWGKRDGKDSKLPDILHKMDNIPLMNTQDCQKFYMDNYQSDIITEQMICTYNPGLYTGPCQRDSGGSIDMYNKELGVYQAVGVVSFGKHCDKDKEGGPAVYSKLTEFKDWIIKQTNCETFCYI